MAKAGSSSSESSGSASAVVEAQLPPDAQAELDRIADALYAARPEEFAATRDAEIKKARADGKPALARELAKLRKPTLSAWLVNLVWRDQREVMEQLFELADELTRAQADAAGSLLRELMTQRRQLEAALLRRATALAEQAGANVTDSVAREAQETITAALAQPDVADEVRSGRLVKPASYSGFGPPPGARPAAPPEKPREAPPAEPIDLQAAQRAREERAEREREERRKAAERQLQEARAAVELAAREVTDRGRAAEAAASRHADLRQQLEHLQDQVRRVEAEVGSAERDAQSAARARDDAEKARAAAEQALERAQKAIEE